MNGDSARFALPLLQPGQAQKEMTHNEALARIDLALGASVLAAGLDAAPTEPTPGQCWIVGDTPVGAWANRAGALAGWTAGGWRFLVPPEGFVVWDQARQIMLRRSKGGWVGGVLSGTKVEIDGQQVLGSRTPAIPDPGGGGTIDAEARSAISAILGALRTHGLIGR